ncbi:MAG TPA: hypothetical protein PLY57_06235 [Deltaproteobacteria bacterium]|nr:hypothetical protein [Deltaproteobacteria bacterium]
MAEDFIGSVKEIEQEAEALMEQARSEARTILEEARRQADDILSRSLPLDEVRKEQEKIVQTAREQAEIMIENARRQAEAHRKAAGARLEEVVNLMLTYLKGGKSSSV